MLKKSDARAKLEPDFSQDIILTQYQHFISSLKYRIDLWIEVLWRFDSSTCWESISGKHNVILTSLCCWWFSSFSSSLDILLKRKRNSDPEVHFQQDLCLPSTLLFNNVIIRTTVCSLRRSLLCLGGLWCLSSLGLSPLVQFPALQNIWEVARWCSMQLLFISEAQVLKGPAFFKLEDPEGFTYVDSSILNLVALNLSPRLFGPRCTFLICPDYTEV